jgi:RNA polymerase sigma-70 factor (ECF subfamily)
LKRPAGEILSLLADHGGGLYALLTRLTLREDVAEDLMQELFLKLTRSNGFGRAEDPLAYAFRAATNLAFDWRRARKRTPPMETTFSEPLSHDRSPLSNLVRREELERVLDAVGGLPRLSRDLVVMRYLEQQGYDTIAGQLGKTPHQVRGLCHKAVGRLRRLLDDKSSTPREPGGSQHEA